MWQSIIDNINVSNGIGVIGIAIGYYLYAKAKPFDRITYMVEETSIISVDEKYGEKLEVVFDGRTVPRVTAARLLLWNTGNAPIEPQNFLAKMPLHIASRDGVDILSCKVVETAARENVTGLSAIQEHQGLLRVQFDVIRPREGFLCELLHTGAKGDISVSGLLRQSSKGIQQTTTFMDGSIFFGSKSKLTRLMFPIFLLALTLFLFAIVYVGSYALTGGIFYLLNLLSGGTQINYLGGRENIQFYSALSLTIVFSIWATNDLFTDWRRRPSKRLRDAFAQSR